MNDVKKISFLGSFVFFLILSLFTFGQIAVGQWRDHLPYNYGEMIAVAGNDVYLLTNVGLLKYSKTSGETEKMSKINGLNDSGIESVAYDSYTGYVIVGYSNGNIDLIKGNQIINIGDIKRKSMNGDKAIYCMDFIDGYVYLGLGFGIVVLDLENLEIRETWYIGQNGGNVKINDLNISGNFIYVATDQGIMRGNINEQLVDFAKWDILTNDFIDESTSWMSEKSYDNLHIINGNLFVNYNDLVANNADTIMIFDGVAWQHFNDDFNDNVYLGGNENQLILCNTYWAKLFDANLNEIQHIWQYQFTSGNESPRPCFIVSSDDNGLWIADKRFGLIYNESSWKFEKIEVNGPLDYTVFDMNAIDSKIVAVAGGMNLSWSPNWTKAMYYEFSQQNWQS